MGCAKMKKLLCHGIGQQCGSKESKTCEENNYD